MIYDKVHEIGNVVIKVDYWRIRKNKSRTIL